MWGADELREWLAEALIAVRDGEHIESPKRYLTMQVDALLTTIAQHVEQRTAAAREILRSLPVTFGGTEDIADMAREVAREFNQRTDYAHRMDALAEERLTAQHQAEARERALLDALREIARMGKVGPDPLPHEDLGGWYRQVLKMGRRAEAALRATPALETRTETLRMALTKAIHALGEVTRLPGVTERIYEHVSAAAREGRAALRESAETAAEAQAAQVREIPSIALSGQVDNDFLDGDAEARREAERVIFEMALEPANGDEVKRWYDMHQAAITASMSKEQRQQVRDTLARLDSGRAGEGNSGS